VTRRNTSLELLTDLQQAILDFVWTKGEATAEQVRAAVRFQHPLTDSSVRTLLRRLEARGLLSHRVEGKVFVFRATLAPQSVVAKTVRHLINRFCGGSVEEFLVGMVDERIVSSHDIERLVSKVKRTR
jgi:BlaI family transcriptional regulator, penicillinase repressor